MHPAIAATLVAACSLWNAAGLVALLSATRTRTLADARARPAAVTVLKPLNGADTGLRANLESFFAQDHPEFELIFGVTNPHDSALRIVAELRADFPNVNVQVIVHEGGSALNPKVNNLLGMLPYATHDLVLISDSNVHAPGHYVSELARFHASTRAGIVTNLFAGTAENTLGSALENVQLNGFCAAGSALPTLSGDAAVIGKSTLFSRAALERLGGLSRLACVLAEDFILGKMFENAGLRVVFAPTCICAPPALVDAQVATSPARGAPRTADQPAPHAALRLASVRRARAALVRADPRPARRRRLGRTSRFPRSVDPVRARPCTGNRGAVRVVPRRVQKARHVARSTPAPVIRHPALLREPARALKRSQSMRAARSAGGGRSARMPNTSRSSTRRTTWNSAHKSLTSRSSPRTSPRFARRSIASAKAAMRSAPKFEQAPFTE
jgi:hypothetical protein